MSRSWRKHPCGQICSCKSERWDKIFWHGIWRAKERDSLRRIALERGGEFIDTDTEDWEMEAFDERQVSNPWWMNKDGKMWYVEDYTRKRDAVFKGRKVLWYCFTEPEWLTDREIRKLMSK